MNLSSKKLLTIVTAVMMVTTIFTMALTPTMAEPSDTDNKLRLYGEGNLSAAFPYTDPEAPFDPLNIEAPPKDFVVFNPAYIQLPGLYVSNVDTRMKVFARQWFVPELVEPVGRVWLDDPNEYVSEDVVTEYTYMFVDKHDLPTYGTAMSPGPHGSYWTRFWMPTCDNDDAQIGIDGCDVDFDGDDDWTVLRRVGDFNGDLRKDIAISTETFELVKGEKLQFLDHMVEVVNVEVISGTPPLISMVVDIYYLGNDEPELIAPNYMAQILPGGYVRSGRHTTNNGPPVAIYEPWYIKAIATGGERAYVQIGRILCTGETFFVDGAEYDIAMIYGPTPNSLKYLTIRNPIPEHDDVNLEDLSVIKEMVADGEIMPLLPPFNRVHDMIDDINIPDCADDPCPLYYPDNIGDVDDGLVCGDDDRLVNEYDTVQERRINDVDALEIYFPGKAIEPRFDTNLWEILDEEDIEGWKWLDIHTMPEFYKDFVYPALPDCDDGTGDFLLVSSWEAPNSCGERVMFVYDQETGILDIYINDYEGYNALRLYGEDGLSAAFPYTDPEAPFDPDPMNVIGEAPPKDFVTFNPSLVRKDCIYVSNEDAKEKVFVRQWFVPELVEPVGKVWLPNPNHYVSEDVVTEYTYMFIDKHYQPTYGTAMGPGGSYWTNFWLPICDNSDEQIGIDGLDIDGDGADDCVQLRAVGDFDGDGLKDIDIASHANFELYEGEELTFLDHKVVVKNVEVISGTPPLISMMVDIYYLGNDEPELIAQNFVAQIVPGEYVSAGRHTVFNGAPDFQEPWYMQAISTGGDRAYVKVGRLLHMGETFFVDAAEYDIAMIYGPTADSLKYITIRNPIPEHYDVNLEDLSVIKKAVMDNETLPLLPPLNRDHDMIDDIDLPDVPDDVCPVYYPDDSDVESRIFAIPALNITFTGKAIEPRFDTNLLEILDEGYMYEGWMWLDIHTMPDFYKEFVYPELPDVPDSNGDWLVTSSFTAPNSCDARVTFVYDAANGTGLYMNQGNRTTGGENCCDIYDTNGIDGIQKEEAVAAIADYLINGTIDKACAVEVLTCYFFP
ncbi:MAG: hypothetical protein SYNGOMJ08_00620 [Candidatus Syntrophoarchaeum sp. GoM_oil]|nr:MAG: hypothetical protein SYNGOMJ08_00620 [Candidatus Syntrophoarchaeum sp. GoM_oil]